MRVLDNGIYRDMTVDEKNMCSNINDKQQDNNETIEELRNEIIDDIIEKFNSSDDLLNKKIEKYKKEKKKIKKGGK